jgi:hypothetical protein
VLVWKIDRFGRSLKHLVNSLAELGALGVAFVSFRDNLDRSTPSGRLMFQIIGAIAEFERALIQERVRAGLRNARAKGRRLGRPRVIVDASRIASLRAQGRSWSQISAEMRIGRGTAQRAVARLPKSFIAEDGIAVPEQVTRDLVKGKGLPQLLSRPLRGRVGGDIAVKNATPVMGQYQKHVKHLEPEGGQENNDDAEEPSSGVGHDPSGEESLFCWVRSHAQGCTAGVSLRQALPSLLSVTIRDC